MSKTANIRAKAEELNKIAETLGEPGDPFAAWEKLECLLATLRWYADAENHRGQLAEHVPDDAAWGMIEGRGWSAKADDLFVLPQVWTDCGERARTLLTAIDETAS